MKLTESAKSVLINENNACSTIVDHLKEIVDRLDGSIDREPTYKSSEVLAKLRKAQDILIEVAEDIEVFGK